MVEVVDLLVDASCNSMRLEFSHAKSSKKIFIHA